MLEARLGHNDCRMTSDQRISTGIEELKRAINFPLVIKSSPCEGIFVDNKSVNWTNLEIVCAKSI